VVGNGWRDGRDDPYPGLAEKEVVVAESSLPGALQAAGI